MATQTTRVASSGKKGKGVKSTPPSPGRSAPSSIKTEDASATAVAMATSSGHGKPDKAAYDLEQEKIKSEIDALQAKLVNIFI